MPCQQTPRQRFLIVLILILCRWNRGNLTVGNKFLHVAFGKQTAMEIPWISSLFKRFYTNVYQRWIFKIAKVVFHYHFLQSLGKPMQNLRIPSTIFANFIHPKHGCCHKCPTNPRFPSLKQTPKCCLSNHWNILGSQPGNQHPKISTHHILQAMTSEDLCTSCRSSCALIESSWPNKKTGDRLDDPCEGYSTWGSIVNLGLEKKNGALDIVLWLDLCFF